MENRGTGLGTYIVAARDRPRSDLMTTRTGALIGPPTALIRMGTLEIDE